MTKTDAPELLSDYIRRPWCVRLAVGLVVLGGILNLYFLYANCPPNLSEDEAHYWEWSRHLDYGYYSKPPGIAWVLAVARGIGSWLGVSQTGAALMPVLRTPAVLFGLLSGLLSIGLARRMFRDDGAGLAVIVLSAAVPMFGVGALLITIDSPMYFCWALTVYCLWRHVETRGSGGQWSVVSGQWWIYAAGGACAAGMMFKPVLIAIPACVAVGCWMSPVIRRAFRTWHAAGAAGIVLLSQVPTVVWNARHGWVTFKHIGTQGGFAGGGGGQWYDFASRLGFYVGMQAGLMGGFLFVVMVLAVVAAMKRETRNAKRERRGQWSVVSGQWPTRDAFLLAFALPLWGFYLVMNLWANTEPNWPAASYFAGMVLLSGHVVRMWNEVPYGAARRWVVFIVLWGVVLSQVGLNMWRMYPVMAEKLRPVAGTAEYYHSAWYPKKWDLSFRLTGFEERAAVVQQVRARMQAARNGRDPLIFTGRYDTSSSLAFYLPGQPFVYSVMSYTGGRRSQYDVWPDLNERRADGTLVHADADGLYVTSFDPSNFAASLDEGEDIFAGTKDFLEASFDRVEGPELGPVLHNGVVMRNLAIFRCYGFRGLPARVGGAY